jgi:HlyD family secretion protein
LLVGFGALAVLVGVLGVWAVTARLAGAVIAQGVVRVDQNRQVIQHPQGGVVGAILARDGDLVEAGAVLLRLDGTFVQSDLELTEGQLDELRARRAQFEAERDGLDALVFPEDLIAAAESDPTIERLLTSQSRFFEARLLTLNQQRAQLTEQIAQARNQIDGVEAQLSAVRLQEDLSRQDLETQQTLLERGLTQAARVSSLQREQARLLGEIGQLETTRAQLFGQIAALQIQDLRLVSTRQEEAVAALRDLEFREIELRERQGRARQTLARMELRAPVSGIVHGSQVFAVQSVIGAGEPIMFIIPQDRPLIILANIEAVQIDQVRLGQPVTLRFSAFDARQSPELTGHVARVSADAFVHEASGISFYQVEIGIDPEELDKLGDQRLVPGMPVEAYIRTSDRSPLSYLTKPLTDYFANAFRER